MVFLILSTQQNFKWQIAELDFKVNYRYTLLYCGSYWLHFAAVVFLQTKGKTLHQQENYNLLYCDTCFIAALWNQTHNISVLYL